MRRLLIAALVFAGLQFETVLTQASHLEAKPYPSTQDWMPTRRVNYRASLPDTFYPTRCCSARAGFDARASWYGPGFHGRKMANGKRFDMNDPTIVAHKTLPFGTRIRAINIENGRSIDVVVRDRGPFVRGHDLDFSKAAANKLGFKKRGLAYVRIQILRIPSKGVS